MSKPSARRPSPESRLVAGFRRAAGWTEAHRRLTGLAVVGALILAVLAAAGLQRDASPRLLLDADAPAAATTAEVERQFGSEPLALVVARPLGELLDADGMVALQRLERDAARISGVKNVFGPAALVNSTLEQIPLVIRQELGPKAAAAERAAAEARRVAKEVKADAATTAAAEMEARLRSLGPARKQYQDLFARFAALGVPSASNGAFVQALMLGAGGAPKDRLRWLLPDDRHALIVIRLKSGLSQGQVDAVGRRLDALATDERSTGLPVTVVGAPLVAAAVARNLNDELLRLLPGVLLAMVALLAIRRRFRPRRGLLIVPGLLGAAAAIASSRIFGLGLTPATLAALPVILGLGVDFSVQLDGAFREARMRHRPGEAARVAIGQLAVPLGRSILAMTLGFGILLLSSVPLVQRLGVLLTIGTGVAFVSAMAIVPSMLQVIDPGRRGPVALPVRVPATLKGARLVAGVAAIVLVAGLALSDGIKLSTDPQQLARHDLPELRRAEAAATTFGAGGQIRVAVRADDVAAPDTLRWMSAAQGRIAKLDPRLRQGPSLAELLTAGGRLPDGALARQMLGVIPPRVARAVVNDRRTFTEFTYTIPPLDADALGRLQHRIDVVLSTAPKGVTADAGGLVPVVTAALDEVKGSRPWLMLAAAVAAFVLLALCGLGPRRAAVSVVPAVGAASACSLLLAATGVRLSPLSASLEPLLVAITVQFSVLVEHRATQLRTAGADAVTAARNAARELAPAIATSTATVACGFAVLMISTVPVLRQFGLVAALEVLVASAFALVVTPALWLLLTEGRSSARRVQRLATTPASSA